MRICDRCGAKDCVPDTIEYVTYRTCNLPAGPGPESCVFSHDLCPACAKELCLLATVLFDAFWVTRRPAPPSVAECLGLDAGARELRVRSAVSTYIHAANLTGRYVDAKA